MNYWYSPLNLLFTLCVFFAGAKGNTFYSLNALNIKNERVSFEEYKGKVSCFMFLPPVNEVWGKVMILHLSVSHSAHGG